MFLDLMGIPVFLHSVRLFDKIADKIVLVTSPDAVEYCQNLLEKEELCAEVIVIAGKKRTFPFIYGRSKGSLRLRF